MVYNKTQNLTEWPILKLETMKLFVIMNFPSINNT